ncbi:Radical SAM family enzyme [Liberibacter crescens BT-1]|uniref:Heme chaperone HemW n=1 Tax=Liberibacter crescens (strain BT-1) TaxID=1215343 RepID=L0EXT6_LIBCB|nr:radical SAM family heme chaperone HemW [Liberibacter crescens]AGA65186.1 Radical SAM family enzyme [Liberibacter crescens BT-1]AMC13142.1 coproporphyrinogen III oxidase [Liberibacter crescens]
MNEKNFSLFPLNLERSNLSIYVHWPFCVSKCPYCDFNSHVRTKLVDQERFVQAFLLEMTRMRQLSGPRTITSIFFGGGTPSLMEPKSIGSILEGIARCWHVPNLDIEITIEANPSSVELERFHEYRAAGVNRVSLGVQALEDEALQFLGRTHSVADSLKAIKLAREVFPRMSFDLIYARPGQTIDGWDLELRQAISYVVDHISLYQLTIEVGTRFFNLHKAGKLIMPDEELSARFYELTQEITLSHGLPAYEISNHAQLGAESTHNLTYWRYGDYVGIGPGAHGRISIDTFRIATATEKNPEHWVSMVESKGHGIIEQEYLSPEEQSDELLLMGLRLHEGIDINRWQQLSRRSLNAEREKELVDLGFIERINSSRLKCTPSGMMILDAVVADLTR